MSEVVESNGAQAGGVGEFAEAFGDGFGVQRRAVLLGEDVTAVDPGASPLVTLLLLAKLVAEQGTDGGFVEVDDAVLAAGGLDRAEVGGVTELDDLAAHGEPGPFDVDVVPPQAQQLTTS
ncbi:MAG: hypothetical protein U0R68_02980 [Candidatus Nanopelagicales bacterium]